MGYYCRGLPYWHRDQSSCDNSTDYVSGAFGDLAVDEGFTFRALVVAQFLPGIRIKSCDSYHILRDQVAFALVVDVGSIFDDCRN